MIKDYDKAITTKTLTSPLTIGDLIHFGHLNPPIVSFLEACVKAKVNIVVSGGAGSGKTAALNILSSLIPEDESIIIIEDTAELQLKRNNVRAMVKQAPDSEVNGTSSILDQINWVVRMYPDRIVIDEIRGVEAFSILYAMNTGCIKGFLATVQANSPQQVLSRLEAMMLMAGTDLAVKYIREHISFAIDLIVHLNRLSEGSRKITHITEVQGMKGDTIVLKDIFTYRQATDRIKKRLIATGIKCQNAIS